jgi:hypothetical protein
MKIEQLRFYRGDKVRNVKGGFTGEVISAFWTLDGRALYAVESEKEPGRVLTYRVDQIKMRKVQ